MSSGEEAAKAVATLRAVRDRYVDTMADFAVIARVLRDPELEKNHPGLDALFMSAQKEWDLTVVELLQIISLLSKIILIDEGDNSDE